MTKTIFCDIDGTILKHKGDIKKNLLETPEILDKVNEKFKEWDKNNYKIILITGRKEGNREQTKEQLKSLGIVYDELIMGLPNGDRIIINDKKENGIEYTAYAYNLVRNEGMNNINFDLNNIEKKIEKPWGYEEIIEYNKNYVVKKLFMKEGHSCSTQYHKLKTETIIILKGKLKILIGDDLNSLQSNDYKEGDNITIKPYTIHKMIGITDCLYLETSTNELWDIVRLNDEYGRI
jgi:mannose-6-phosphate isomerase-like protein (cupin superfamily)